MKLLKKSFRLLIVAVLVAAFALTMTACKKDDKHVTTYIVRYVTNMPSVSVAPEYVEEGNTAKRPADPTYEGYTFVNWYESSSLDGDPYDFTTPVTANKTLYAKWKQGSDDKDDPKDDPTGEKITVTLNYNYDNKTESVKVTSGNILPTEYSNPEREGYSFGGWFTDKGLAMADFYNMQSVITSAITLYAKWTVKGTDGDGINFAKYWDGSNGETTGGSDGFTFTNKVNIGSVTVDPDDVTPPKSEGAQCIVTFNSKGGSAVSAQAIANGNTAIEPETPDYDGYMFCGWYTDNACSDNKLYDFNTKVDESFTLYAKWVQLDAKIQSVNGYNESLAVVWTDSNPASASVQYKLKDTNTWKNVDSMLIRNVDGDARVDILGLAEGDYNVKITPSSGSSIELPEAVHVSSYDRSGYAHFKYTSGVGAYNDDGTLKENALVIYVTNENKNNVKEYVYKNTANGLVKEDISAYIKSGTPTSNGKPLGGDSYWSIGYILNNRGYENNTERETYGIQKLTFTYSAVVVRLIGTITSETDYSTGAPSLHGLTYYAKAGQTNPITGDKYAKGVAVPNGGTVNDDGEMARITNAKNLTIEGIGEDAVMEGWGIHFVSNDNLHKHQGAGTSFEVRNITFKNYPEDAIGMEGTQGTKVDNTGSITGGASAADADLISPVERCWVHHNTFLPGYCSNPAESDKADGDGSCDFKRGQFYTLSYNHFSNCHKTNLIGSSDTTQTFNVTIHHNWYESVKARQPLARRANIHYYNNYVSDATDYVTSFRGNCLVFSEANYYDGCKQVTQKKDGVGVAWNNIYYSCYNENNYIELTSRTDTVANSCKFLYRNIDYTQFYIDSDLFYYDSVNKVSDCLLDDAVGARIRVLTSAGVNGSGKKDTTINQYTPSKAVTAGTSINAKAVNGDGEVNGVLFKNFKSGKGKGQIATFILTAPMEVTITDAAGSGDSIPQLIDSYGKVWLEKFTGDKTVVLPEGTYIIATGQKDKESTIGTITFADTAASSEARVNKAKAALAAIPDEIGYNDKEVIKDALTAYSALSTTEERDQIDNSLITRLRKAEAAYNDLRVQYVIARIDYIGTVTKESYIKINAAWTAYSELDASLLSKVTNYSTLEAAQEAFEQFAVQNVIDRILDLPDLSKATILTNETLERVQTWFNAVNNAYELLGADDEDDGQQAQVKAHNDGKTYAMLTNGLAELDKCKNLINFIVALEDISVDDVTTGNGAALKNMHDALTEAQLETLSSAQVEKYNSVMAIYTELASKSVASTFVGGKSSNEAFKVNSGSAKNSKVEINAYGGELESGIKMESATQIEFTITTKMVLKLYLDGSGNIKVGTDGSSKNKVDPAYDTEVENGDNVATIILEAGTYFITKGSSLNLYYATLTPAS